MVKKPTKEQVTKWVTKFNTLNAKKLGPGGGDFPSGMTKLCQAFWAEMQMPAHLIDPEDDLCWYDLTVGWAVGKGATPSQAHNIAALIHYYTW